MYKLFSVFILILLTFTTKAQPKSPGVQPFGIIDTADLKMTQCDFEKDANAMVLFDKGVVTYKYGKIRMERQKRIKILNEKGKDEANIRIDYYGVHADEQISDVMAETVNLDGKTIKFTAVDKKLIYTETTNKNEKALILTFPDVRPGSVIEFSYLWSTPDPYNYPDWFFQATLPTRYSEFDASFSPLYVFNVFQKSYRPTLKDTIINIKSPMGVRHIWALGNIKSYQEEAFMDYPEDYIEGVVLKRFRWYNTLTHAGNEMLDDEDFGSQLKKKLDNEEQIIANARALKTDGDKIKYVFDTVKRAMKWNKTDRWYTVAGVKKAWHEQTGNSTEINLILYHLLKAANVNVLLMTLKTRENGKLDPDYISLAQMNKTVVYYPIDTLNYYVLDATNPYNTYNNIPLDLNGLTTVSVDADNKIFKLVPLKYGAAREVILINGNISTGGKLAGITQISSTGYGREKYLKRFDKLGEKEYISELQTNNNGLRIDSLKIQNVQTDTLPLTQTLSFKYNLTEPDGNYMYFNPNLFTGFEINPFLSEERISNIEFGSINTYSVNGRYQIPKGYKVDVLPTQTSLVMPDKSINFRRTIGEAEGVISVQYLINFKRSFFTQQEYRSIRDFYKKMYEMLNEQVVLKKIN